MLTRMCERDWGVDHDSDVGGIGIGTAAILLSRQRWRNPAVV